MPMVLTALSGLQPAPLPSVWKGKKQIWQVVLSVIFLPSGRQREPMLPNFFTGRASMGGKLSNNYVFLLPVTRSGLSFCWQSFSYGRRPDHRKDLV